MKILIISDAWKPQINGVVRTYEYIGDELVKMGHDFHVIGPADFPIRIPLPGYAEIELAIAPYGRLKRMIEEYIPDAIHIATEGPLGKAAHKYCRKHDLKFTTSYHTHFPDYIAKRIGKFLPFLAKPVKNSAIKSLREFHSHAAGMFIATQSLEDELRAWGFKSPMHRLSRGARLDVFRPLENDGPKELFRDLPQPVALYVGRVAIEKNLEDLLGMEWGGSIVIVGDGPNMDELKRNFPHAHFVGKKIGEELGAHYRNADVFVFPSRTDTFGMVLVEALASGIPVAAYNVTGPCDIITENFLGALHEHDLSDAVKRALEKTNLVQQRRNHVEEHYTWPVVGQQFLRVLEDIGK